ncbi:ATP-binding protein [Kribbia dieselivorans]|uniref:ATP-binding protein n=1 Tax=Kribbia dieselivorans TaxID=331526 RepID=UPI00083958CD|nr:ATP-binding protein [Kribbia dieselivorans]
MSDGLFSSVEVAAQGRPGYRLHRVEVFNWGTFDRFVWRLDLGGDTSLLTGDIGSGKSTLVDAITTLLMPAHRIEYNKAAGAEAKERDLRSYVEGHYKSERNEATGVSRPVGLRPDSSTYSVVLGVFVNDGYDETVSIAQVFQQRERTGQPNRFYITADKGLSVEADFSDFGADLSDLRRRLRAGGAEVFDAFAPYSTSLRRRLGIRSEQAMKLFHQTVSMKSVGNLNEFVRDHMLEPADAADRIRGIIGHFEDLSTSHALVIRAREQLELLTPLVALADRYDGALAERAAIAVQREAVRLFIAELQIRLLGAEIAGHEEEVTRISRAVDEAEETARTLDADRDRLIEERAQAGGDRVAELERTAREARAQAADRLRRRHGFDEALTAAGLDPISDVGGFAALATTVAAEKAELALERPRVNNRLAELLSAQKQFDVDAEAVRQELASLQQRTSNLPSSHLQLRDQLCADLGLDPVDLPYAGELLDVSEEHVDWRGAAERVLRGFALSMLVPQVHYPAVTDWVNGRRLTVRGRDGQVGAKLVYERVPDRRVPLQRADRDGLLLADCLVAKPGAFDGYLRAEVQRRANYVCVDSLAAFREETRAVTREGQVRSGERHEKDDRNRVDDPRRWVLGWANERKIEALATDLTRLEAQRSESEREVKVAEEAHNRLREREIALGKLADHTSWSDLDHEGAHARAADADAERERLQAGSSRLAEVTRALAATDAKLTEVRATRDDLKESLTTARNRRDEAELTRSVAQQQIAAHPEADLESARAAYPALTERLGASLPTQSGQCAGASNTLTDQLDKQAGNVTNQINSLTGHLQQAMGEVLGRWPELRSDMDASVEAREDFRAFHTRVAGDDLPRFEEEFKRQLNTNTIHELAGFNAWLHQRSDEIRDRVDRINEALGAIDYSPGRYIKLEPKPTTNQDVQTFRADLRHATDDAVGAEDSYTEQRFLDVKRLIERFRGREGSAESDKAWVRRVTDVRTWWTFSASEKSRETDVEWEHYTDSDGKSGGQKEKLAYTILAASLAYQFGLEWGAEKSRDFRFAMIDEAFGRGSDVSTTYALQLFRKLGLQLLIVTPLQKVHVIEPYVKAIGFVANPDGMRSTVHTLTIEEFHERRAGASR